MFDDGIQLMKSPPHNLQLGFLGFGGNLSQLFLVNIPSIMEGLSILLEGAGLAFDIQK